MNAFRKKLLFIPVLVVLGAAAQRADASVASDTFNLVNNNGTAFTGGPPYVSVKLTADSTAGSVTFDVKVLTSSLDKIGSFGFNTDLTLHTTGTANLLTAPAGWSTSSNNLDGFGSFTWVLSNNGNQGNASGTLYNEVTFAVTGLTFTNPSAELAHFELNNSGGGNSPPGESKYAAHLFQNDTSGLTGFVDGATQVVPEPSMLAIGLINGLSFFGVSWFRQRRRPKNVVAS